MLDPEYKEFFTRDTQVNSGAKPDIETGFPVQYTINTETGIKTVFNRFLKEHFPNEKVFKKLFKSITFKLNPEDTASTTIQGLAKTASNADVKSNTTYVDGFTRLTQPYQLPTTEHLANAATFASPIDQITTDSFPTDVALVAIDSGTTTRNKFTITIKNTLNSFLVTVVTGIKAYINTWGITSITYSSHATVVGAQITTTAATTAVARQTVINIYDETWKTVGNAGTMANGQAIPSFEANWGVDGAYNTMAIRKTHDGKLAIRGGLTCTANISASGIVLTLPTGYRAATNIIPYLVAYLDNGNSIIPLRITTGGVVRLASTAGLTNGDSIRIPEQIISLD